jgi:hypothetical protein
MGLHTKCPLFLYDFDQIWNFSADFHTSAHTKFERPVEAALITGGRTDRWEDGFDEDNRLFAIMRTRVKWLGFLSVPSQQGNSCMELVRQPVSQSVSQSVSQCFYLKNARLPSSEAKFHCLC